MFYEHPFQYCWTNEYVRYNNVTLYGILNDFQNDLVRRKDSWSSGLRKSESRKNSTSAETSV